MHANTQKVLPVDLNCYNAACLESVLTLCVQINCTVKKVMLFMLKLGGLHGGLRKLEYV